ncbi:MAG: PhoH family protein [Endozoicomonadaceae bacterium]|nr:PhoH family protein [Endozoicomonadaceae bacterium]
MPRAVKLKSISLPQTITYVLDSNVLIHDPNALLNFDEHRVIIPMTVLEELDHLKNSKQIIASDCRQAIRLIDKIVGSACPEEIARGVPINRAMQSPQQGTLAIIMEHAKSNLTHLSNNLNDNQIINDVCQLQKAHPDGKVVLVTKDINMRLKARGCGIHAEDYHSDHQVSDINLLSKGFLEVNGSFWDNVEQVDTEQVGGYTYHTLSRTDRLKEIAINEFILDEQGFVGRVIQATDHTIRLLHLSYDQLMNQKAWGLKPLDIYQAIALYLLLDPDIHLVNLNGPAGSGKTILALAAAIEMTVASKQYRRIIATRSTRGLDEDIGYLPGTEQEKMEPWLGAITDNMEALHKDDENTNSSVDYILEQMPIHFKSLNYIRGRSFQESLIIIDECQNLTPHQMKTIITRAGMGTKVICLGNLAQIDTPYLSPVSSGLTYLTGRFRGFEYGGMIHLEGVPRSALAAYAEENL